MNIKPYVAYGSNLNVNQMKFRCPDAKLIGIGMLHDYRLVFKYHADIVSDKGADVPVALWNITESDLAALDVYEGYPNYYGTADVQVYVDGKMIDAFAYVMRDVQDAIVPPSADYFNVIRQGYIDTGLDLDYLVKAYEEAICETAK